MTWTRLASAGCGLVWVESSGYWLDVEQRSSYGRWYVLRLVGDCACSTASRLAQSAHSNVVLGNSLAPHRCTKAFFSYTYTLQHILSTGGWKSPPLQNALEQRVSWNQTTNLLTEDTNTNRIQPENASPTVWTLFSTFEASLDMCPCVSWCHVFWLPTWFR